MVRHEDYTIEIGPMGPIGEGEALILRVNRNCPWNRCLFCPVYKGKKFGLRSVTEVKADIDATGRVRDLLEAISWEMGLNGRIKGEAIRELVTRHPDIYGSYAAGMTDPQLRALQSLGNMANWFLHGSRRVFLQDADALITKPGDLAEVITHLRKTFPTIETVTAYARSKTCSKRTPSELQELKDAGLSWTFVGIESGCNSVLDSMKKGVTKAEHIEGSRKIMAAGIKMAAFVMPGLAGDDANLSRKHIEETAEVLNEVRPTEVRVRSLAVIEGTPLHEKWKEREFDPPSDTVMIEELKALIEGISFDCIFETLQMTNPLFSVRGSFSRKRESMLDMIDRYLALPPLEKSRFLLHRFVEEGYLACVESWGKCDAGLKNMIKDAIRAVKEESPDAEEKVNRTVFAIRSKGVP